MAALWGAAGDVAEGGDAEVDGGVAEGVALELGEPVFGAGEADLESFDLAEPAFVFGFDNPGLQVVADLFQPCPLCRVWWQERASDTRPTEMILLKLAWPLLNRHSRRVFKGIFDRSAFGRVAGAVVDLGELSQSELLSAYLIARSITGRYALT
jgi:hypothetical protein